MKLTAFLSAGILGLALASAAARNLCSRPEVPILIEATSDMDACGAMGVVKGLDPHGDGFLAVRSKPSPQSEQIDKLYNGETLYLCNQQGDWYGVVYSKNRGDCNVSTSWQKPCLIPDLVDQAGRTRSGSNCMPGKFR